MSTTASAAASATSAYDGLQGRLASYASKHSNTTVSTWRNGRQGFFIDPPGVSVGDLADFFTTVIEEPNFKSFIPGEDTPIPLNFEQGQNLTLQSLALTRGEDGKSINLSFSIQWHDVQHEIDAPTVGAGSAKKETPFALQEIGITFEMIEQSIAAVLNAKLTVEGVTLDTKVSLPGLIFEASLIQPPALDDDSPPVGVGSKKAAIPNGDRVAQTYLPALTKKKKITVQELKIFIALRQKRFLFFLEIDDLLDLKPLKLQRLQAEVVYAPGVGGETDIKLYGDVEIEMGTDYLPILISLGGEYSSDTGFYLSGNIGSQGINVSEVIGAIAGIFSPSSPPPSLPEELATLRIVQLGFTYKSKPAEFTFVIEVEFKVSEEDPAVDVQLTYTGVTNDMKITGVITIGEEKFELVLEDKQVGLPGSKPEGDESSKPADRLTLAAVYAPPLEEGAISLKNIVTSISDSDALGNLTPDLTITIQDVLFAYLKQKESKLALFGLALGSDISLTSLPLVGKLMDKDAALGLNDIQVLFATDNFAGSDVEHINNMLTSSILPAHVLPLPAPNAPLTGGGSGTGQGAAPPALNEGFNFSANLNLGTSSETLSTAGDEPARGSAADVSGAGGAMVPSTATSPVPVPAGSAQWLEIQKSLGPIYFERVGLRYDKGEIWVLLSGALTAGGLTLGLEGLGISSSLSKFDPHFHLQGISLDFKEGPLEIGGAFMRYPMTLGDITFDEFDGMVTVKTEEMALAAIGSYARFAGHTSLFVYISIDYPLGGPPFFFVKGLAGGFGYNRDLIVPPAEQLPQFPLVAEAIATAESNKASKLAKKGSKPAGEDAKESVPEQQDEKEEGGGGAGEEKNEVQAPSTGAIKDRLANELEQIRSYIPVSPGEYWLAVGVRFTTFEIVDTFALLTIAFGNRFEINLLGISTVVMPPDAPAEEPPMARVEIALKATFAPDEGFLGVRAVLTGNSYVFDAKAHLTGGVAFYAWFKDNPQDNPDSYQAGDFALTVGGYHPRFKVPAYFPQVPRLGLNWTINSELSVKGQAYFALTGHALMAGGMLEAIYQSGSIKAWFKAGADFLITWKPFSYDIEIYIDIGASATIDAFGTHHINIHLGADLHIWGPEFSGLAKIHYYVLSFKVSFGGDQKKLAAIPWEDFRQTFLPAGDHNLVSFSATGGLIKSFADSSLDDGWQLVASPGQNHWLFNRKDFALVLGTVIPVKEAVKFTPRSEGEENKAAPVTAVGIAPMDLRQEHFQSKLEIDITYEGGKLADDHFAFEPVLKSMPAGLWGNAFQPDLNDKRLVSNAIGGYRITAGQAPTPGTSHDIDRRNLAFADGGDKADAYYAWEDSSAIYPTVPATTSNEPIDVKPSILQGALFSKLFGAGNGHGPAAPGPLPEFLSEPVVEALPQTQTMEGVYGG